MRIKKGDYGYIRSQKIIRLVRTLLIFALAFAILVVGLVLNDGDRKNIYTVIAMVGCIPACMSAVSVIMMWMRKPMEKALYERIEKHTGDPLMLYEMYFTTRDISLFVDAVAVSGEYIMCYTHEADRKAADIKFIETHLTKTMRAEGFNETVKIFTQEKAYLERLDSLCEKAEESGDREWKICEVLKAIAL